MDDPVTTLIGMTLVGAGILLVFGAYRNRKVLGADGILPTALSTGKLTDLESIPPAFGPDTRPTTEVKTAASMSGSASLGVSNSIGRIGQRSSTLANALSNQISAIVMLGEKTPPTKLGPVRQSLTITRGLGFVEEADTIRRYLEGITHGTI